ncbi:hypothetical protein [Streptomyces sp. NBC_01363]|nr:hypothetical protein [Streptomyces sp. NBC_01363]MCX4730645.1 hypothetical protein [Streptomyces sp. NBC_01363]
MTTVVPRLAFRTDNAAESMASIVASAQDAVEGKGTYAGAVLEYFEI